jgi:leucyl-tRNA synthetase
MMILANSGTPANQEWKQEWLEKFAIILHPFVPHFAEELWEKLGNKQSIFSASWPEYDEKLVVDDEVIIWVQVLGKLRWELAINVAENKDIILQKARELEGVAKWIEWKEIIKEIYVPGKIVNIVIK